MATVRKSLTITEAQEQWIKLQIENGGFANDSEFLITKAAIREGYDSGVSPKIRTVDEIMKAALDRRTDKSQEQQNA